MEATEERPSSTAPEAEPDGESQILRLYIAGQTPRSIAAFANLKRICEQHLAGRVGLTLVRRLVELHGGRVEAVSAGRGRGTEFTVRLPVLAEAPQAGGRAAEAAPGTARKRILVV